jgi:hypothetical protein
MMKNLRLGLRSNGKKKYVALFRRYTSTTLFSPITFGLFVHDTLLAFRGGHSYFQFWRPSKITELGELQFYLLDY